MSTSLYWNYDLYDPIRVQIQLGPAGTRSLAAHLEQQSAYLRESIAARRRVYIIIDARNSHQPPPEVRKLQAEWMERERDLIAATCVGMSFVISRPIIRGALTAIFWVTKPPVAHKVQATLAEALVHAVDVLDAHGLPVAPGAREPDADLQIEAAYERQLSHQVAL